MSDTWYHDKTMTQLMAGLQALYDDVPEKFPTMQDRWQWEADFHDHVHAIYRVSTELADTAGEDEEFFGRAAMLMDDVYGPDSSNDMEMDEEWWSGLYLGIDFLQGLFRRTDERFHMLTVNQMYAEWDREDHQATA